MRFKSTSAMHAAGWLPTVCVISTKLVSRPSAIDPKSPTPSPRACERPASRNPGGCEGPGTGVVVGGAVVVGAAVVVVVVVVPGGFVVVVTGGAFVVVETVGETVVVDETVDAEPVVVGDDVTNAVVVVVGASVVVAALVVVVVVGTAEVAVVVVGGGDVGDAVVVVVGSSQKHVKFRRTCTGFNTPTCLTSTISSPNMATLDAATENCASMIALPKFGGFGL